MTAAIRENPRIVPGVLARERKGWTAWLYFNPELEATNEEVMLSDVPRFTRGMVIARLDGFRNVEGNVEMGTVVLVFDVPTGRMGWTFFEAITAVKPQAKRW